MVKKLIVTTDAGEPPAGARSGMTATLSDPARRSISLAPHEPITSLRYVGGDRAPLTLQASQRRFSIGAGACELVIPREVSKKVSALHAAIERRGSALEVRDQGSKNGSFLVQDEPRLAVFQIKAGETFWLADAHLQAMDPLLDGLRPMVAWCIGLDRHAVVDAAIETIAGGGPLALVAPTGSDAELLAAAIHAASVRRQNFFLAVTSAPLPSLDHARGGTAFVDLRRLTKLPATYATTLFGSTGVQRPIFAASDVRELRKHLDEHDRDVAVVALTPLGKRRKEVPRLLARHWLDELRTHRRPDELGPALTALERYSWPRGVEELREQSPRILAYLVHGTLREAAASLGIAHQTLAAHFKRIGFPIRDVAKRPG